MRTKGLTEYESSCNCYADTESSKPRNERNGDILNICERNLERLCRVSHSDELGISFSSPIVQIFRMSPFPFPLRLNETHSHDCDEQPCNRGGPCSKLRRGTLQFGRC